MSQFVPTLAIALLAASAAAQNQASGSLADAARQARAQKQGQSADSGHAQQFADELSEDQNEKDAPAGFKTYNAGAYKVLVPAPYTVNGHDDGGIVLAGPNIGKTTPLVLAGNTVALHGGDNDDAFRDAATRFARRYLPSANCTKTGVANHDAYQCTLAGGHLLDHVVSGGAVFLRSANNMFPILCLSTTASNAREIVNDPQASPANKLTARGEIAQEDQYAREVWKRCETVFQSIRVPDGSGGQAETEPAVKAQADGAGTNPQKSADVAGAPATQQTSASAAGGNEGSGAAKASPAEAAGGAQQGTAEQAAAPASQVPAAAQSSVPAGLKAHHFNYCQGPGQCWDASVLVPAEAQLINSDCKQYVFELKVQGQPFFLLTGPTAGDGCQQRNAMDPSLVRWQQLVAPENMRAPGTSNTISEQQMPLDGKRAIITKIKFRKGLAEWIGKRAELQSKGIPIVVGCMAPAEWFADGEDICSALIESLRLP